MLTWEESVEATALHKQGWSLSAIARHLGRDRKTIRAYVNGARVPGQRASQGPDWFVEFVEYCRLRLGDDPHLWATTLFDEVRELGYGGSYPAFTAALRARELRPHCQPCAQAKTTDRSVIDHPSGAETQWDWVELPDPPPAWGWGETAYMLVGVLPHSSRWRAWLAEATDQAHLIEGLDQVTRRLGGVAKRWRFDRTSTVCHPASGRLQATFGPVAVHYAVGVDLCPARHGWRKGSVEKGIHSITQRWWRTLPDEATPASAQASLDRFCTRQDSRSRRRDGHKTTVGALADAEPLREVPAPYPATIDVPRTVSDQALVSFRGNFYSVPPGHSGELVQVRHRLGATEIDIVTHAGTALARHVRQPDSAGAICRLDEHVAALERVVLASFSDRGPCRRKDRRPPSREALAEAERIRAGRTHATGEQVVVDFAAYAEQTLPLTGRSQPGTEGGEA